MLEKQYELMQLINIDGDVPSCKKEDVEKQEALALDVMESFLGCTIRVHGQDFILTSLELYYGGIGDMAHDWYRSSYAEKYPTKSRHSAGNTRAQISEGPLFYFNGNGLRRRCDLVVGNAGVAVSFLIRNVLDKDLIPLGTKNGQPNVVLKRMGLLSDSNHGKPVEIIDTRDAVLKGGYTINKRKRYSSGKFEGFDYDCPFAQKAWNFSLELD
ncbi:hypothetical protein ABXT60_04465 [Candidatus Njordibacter sp. Uisw_056]|uniref:hypothetical protein n=1 Tax=Candidatus Njordibacter sp. Uisw_056 TaxID=3230973 RepID=UPI003D4CA2F1